MRLNEVHKCLCCQLSLQLGVKAYATLEKVCYEDFSKKQESSIAYPFSFPCYSYLECHHNSWKKAVIREKPIKFQGQ